MQLTYVCTNFNNSALTVESVNSLFLNFEHEINVVVVDNASSVRERDILKNSFGDDPRIFIFFSEENIGYFHGLNLGFDIAMKKFGSLGWVVAGNNDLVFPHDFCEKLHSLGDCLAGKLVISPDVVTLDGLHQNPHVLKNIGAFRKLMYDLYHSNYYFGMTIKSVSKFLSPFFSRKDVNEWRVSQYIRQGHGSVYILTPLFFQKISKFWCPVFMMHEELFLAIQLEEAGEAVWYESNLQIVHKWHGSLDKLPSRRRWEMARDAHRVARNYY